MPDNPFITIVVPSYNRADLIAKTLKTLQSLNYDNYEIIVVDDGSTDNTEEVIKTVADHRTQYVKKINGERAAARNFGAAMAKGDYVNFFDSDDLAFPNHLAVAAGIINKRNNPEWLHLAFAWADSDGKLIRKVNNFKGETLNDSIASGNPLSCNGVFIRKDIILSNKFNEDRLLSASEDYELWCRLAARFALYYSNSITSLVIDHDLRSVRTMNGDKLIKRLDLLIHYLLKDEKVVDYFGENFSKIKMDSHSYIALHLAEQPAYKIKAVQFLIKALFDSMGLVKKRRFYAIIKNLIIKW